MTEQLAIWGLLDSRIYGPGGYKFTDYVRVGGPLQAVFAVVTTLGIAFIWGLQPPA